MRRPASRWIVACLIAACSAGQGPPLPTRPDVAGRSDPPPNTPAAPPTTGRATPPESPPAPRESPVPPSTRERPTDVLPLPPGAMLVLSGVEHPGRRGSFCYGGLCGDAPYPAPASLPGIGLREADQELRVTLDDGSRFRWAATISGTSDEAGDEQTLLGASGRTEGSVREASFRGPPTGSWVLQLSIDFDDELGSANHYWRLEVP